MAGNNSIQILRGTRDAILSSSETLLAGQLLYNSTDNTLTVGSSDNTSIKKLPINAWGIGGYYNEYDLNSIQSAGSSGGYRYYARGGEDGLFDIYSDWDICITGGVAGSSSGEQAIKVFSPRKILILSDTSGGSHDYTKSSLELLDGVYGTGYVKLKSNDIQINAASAGGGGISIHAYGDQQIGYLNITDSYGTFLSLSTGYSIYEDSKAKLQADEVSVIAEGNPSDFDSTTVGENVGHLKLQGYKVTINGWNCPSSSLYSNLFSKVATLSPMTRSAVLESGSAYIMCGDRNQYLFIKSLGVGNASVSAYYQNSDTGTSGGGTCTAGTSDASGGIIGLGEKGIHGFQGAGRIFNGSSYPIEIEWFAGQGDPYNGGHSQNTSFGKFIADPYSFVEFMCFTPGTTAQTIVIKNTPSILANQ